MVNYKEDFQADLFLSGCEIDKQTYEQDSFDLITSLI